MLFTVAVGIALSRPPRHDVTVRVIVSADDWIQAELTAIDMAVGTIQMRNSNRKPGTKFDPHPVSTFIEDWTE